MHHDSQPDPTDSLPRQRPLRELELELAHKLFDALLMRLDRVLACPFEKERVHQLAKLVQVASRLGRKPSAADEKT
jgi:hypothetical protein